LHASPAQENFIVLRVFLCKSSVSRRPALPNRPLPHRRRRRQLCQTCSSRTRQPTSPTQLPRRRRRALRGRRALQDRQSCTFSVQDRFTFPSWIPGGKPGLNSKVGFEIQMLTCAFLNWNFGGPSLGGGVRGGGGGRQVRLSSFKHPVHKMALYVASLGITRLSTYSAIFWEGCPKLGPHIFQVLRRTCVPISYAKKNHMLAHRRSAQRSYTIRANGPRDVGDVSCCSGTTATRVLLRFPSSSERCLFSMVVSTDLQLIPSDPPASCLHCMCKGCSRARSHIFVLLILLLRRSLLALCMHACRHP